MSPTTRACFAPRVTARRVVEHVGHRDRGSRSRSRASPGRASRRRAGAGCRPRRGAWPSGSRRRSASRSAGRRRGAWRCRRRSGGGRSRSVALTRGSPAVMRLQSARPRRGRPAPRRPGRGSRRRPRAWRAAAGRPASPSADRIETRFVSVPKPEPASATSLATRRSTPLRRSLSAARSSEPVSAANPTRIGRGSGRPSARRPPRRRRRGCPRSARARGSGRRRGRASSSAAVARPEVGDGGGHDQGVAPPADRGRATSRAHLGGRLGADDVQPRLAAAATLDAGRRSASPARRDRGPPAAMATPILPVERLPMNRTGSIGSRRAAGGDHDVAARRGPRRARSATSGGRAAGSGGADRPVRRRPRRPRRRSRPVSASRPDARLAADASGPASGSTIRVAEVVAQPGDVGPGRRMAVHLAVHRRRDDDRRRGREARRGHGVAGEAGRPSPPSQWAVAGATTIASALSAMTMWPIRPSGRRPPTSVSTGWRVRAANVSGADEAGRGRGEQDDDVGALGAAGGGAARRPCRRRSSR